MNIRLFVVLTCLSAMGGRASSPPIGCKCSLSCCSILVETPREGSRIEFVRLAEVSPLPVRLRQNFDRRGQGREYVEIREERVARAFAG